MAATPQSNRPINTPENAITSTFAGDPDMNELIELFVGDLPDRVREVEQSWHNQKLSDLKRIAHQLKGASAGYGFPALGSVAGELEQALSQPMADETEVLEQARRHVDELLDLCKRVAVL